MTRTALLLLAATAVSTGVFAQTNPDIDKALLAAPANLREGATVIKWKPDFTYDTLKKGTNRLVCFDKSGLRLTIVATLKWYVPPNRDISGKCRAI